MKIATVIGARPQFVKAAPLSRALRRRHEEILIHTGQHYDYDMSKVFFEELAIPAPDFHLDIRETGHAAQTGRMLIAIEKILLETRPGAVVVLGDTNSTLAGALAAAKLNIPVAHVEAGLRSFNRRMPEEINRILADHVSGWLFAPTVVAVGNLAAEGITRGVTNTGDVMMDIVLENLPRIETHTAALGEHGLSPKGYYLATIHRDFNTDNPANLAAILEGLSSLDKPVLFPIHPRTRKAVEALRGASSIAAGREDVIRFIPPVGYLTMLTFQRHAFKIITDSGGIQKEAYLLGTPCITLRPETEWVETVESGWNRLIPAAPSEIRAAAVAPFTPSRREPYYGNGDAAVRIAEILSCE
ncbi:MAG: UDP-N-acetylglucosamine 2-epimerase (non-hydrolyzing) [Planctomycetota bacterium]